GRMPGRRAGEEERERQILDAAASLAMRTGLDRLTVRAIAARAGLSNGLVHFHFENKDALLLALLDELLKATLVLDISPEVAAVAQPRERLRRLLRTEMERLAGAPARLRLFFEFWLWGMRRREVRRRLRKQLDRYRAAFLPIADEVLAEVPERFAHVGREGLAHACAGFVKAAAVQSVIDPARFRVDQFIDAVTALARVDTSSP
ncbi:MAG TPA: helix-turn-helix domain-containing protein, partial [Longimicrobiaceae bacterium]|nr:helix-turn-helix domain-containing protein [Longimicrobiaceae bacterium]